MYQACSPDVPASCNCAVAVQSGDDVIVIDRCRRDRKTLRRLLGGRTKQFTKMSVDVYLNGELTLGTHVYEEADGRKYVITLPHGTYVKVMVSADLLNVWVVASPKDYALTSGLCGTNDNSIYNDLELRNEKIMPFVEQTGWTRHEPRDFCLDWRVTSRNTIFEGVEPRADVTPPLRYCSCLSKRQHCGYAVDVSMCDILQGKKKYPDLTRSF